MLPLPNDPWTPNLNLGTPTTLPANGMDATAAMANHGDDDPWMMPAAAAAAALLNDAPLTGTLTPDDAPGCFLRNTFS